MWQSREIYTIWWDIYLFWGFEKRFVKRDKKDADDTLYPTARRFEVACDPEIGASFGIRRAGHRFLHSRVIVCHILCTSRLLSGGVLLLGDWLGVWTKCEFRP